MIAASIGNTHHFDEDEVFIRLPRRIAGQADRLFAALSPPWRMRAIFSHADEADLNPIAS
jgi:hypothetical protein